MLRYICFFAFVLGARSALAPFIKPCQAGDKPCILASAQAAIPIIAPGIPELGVPSLDPLHLAVIKGNQGGLALTFTDTTVTGLKGCVMDGIKHDLAKGKQTITIRCSVELVGDYKLGGKILILPINGNGKYNIEIRDIVIKATNDITVSDGADGKPHWHISNWKFSSVTKTGAKFTFKNLFNGNKVLAAPVEAFVNSNWREVMQEIAPPIVSAIVERVQQAVEALYKAVPADELTSA